MLDDPLRTAFCVTPTEAETGYRNTYFKSICYSMSNAVAETIRLQIRMKEQCLRTPQLGVCSRLTW